MSPFSRPVRNVLLATALAATGLAAHAGFLAAVQLQGPPAGLESGFPVPNLVPFATTIAGFNSNVTILGGNEVEGTSPSASFGYGSGSATAVGLAVIDAASTLSNLGLGRYNTTPGVNPGHWLESSTNFSFTFSEAISAFSFFGTDFGDYSGTVTIALFNGATSVFERSFGGNGVNGDLTFIGLKGQDSGDQFDRVAFTLSNRADFIGIDSLTVGSVNGVTPPPGPVPEPGSLALAALALAAAARVMRSRKQR